MSPIITPNQLLVAVQSNAIVLVDATNSPTAYQNYQQSHLQGALFVDVNTQLADIKEDVSIGGRHPLPTVEQFSKTLTDLGITPETWVVVYDDKNGANAAARFWWMLRSIGHQKVQVLSGGIQAAIQAGFPTSSAVEVPTLVESYPVQDWQWPTIDLQGMDEMILKDRFVIIDVRESQRYRGETEPIDLVAGHIPGATNIPFMTNLDENGFFLSPEELKAKYQKVFENIPEENRVVHCGSGVTACHTLLALAIADLPIPQLYVGSWSEWSRNNREIVVEQ
ncbi:sulfurtransferase [Flavobacterium ammonificans]|jgi:thiosulfate/3-mercaptopyruvate sulfurtransferase|uniref:sulfurtransferase n=1 Tax=Flavobacterium ammonificans TaxID=1751056 RepID=UPI001E324342|nr:sulfurtransferase [Flavobacterium ammonificans]BDB57066.1 thiosulfate sulfurtransferase [Flavobacterium ammonificans]